MDINKVHIPERLQDETMAQYRQRQQLSKRLSGYMRMTHDSARRGTYFREGVESTQKPGAIKRRALNAAKESQERKSVHDHEGRPALARQTQ